MIPNRITSEGVNEMNLKTILLTTAALLITGGTTVFASTQTEDRSEMVPDSYEYEAFNEGEFEERIAEHRQWLDEHSEADPNEWFESHPMSDHHQWLEENQDKDLGEWFENHPMSEYRHRFEERRGSEYRTDYGMMRSRNVRGNRHCHRFRR